MRRGVPATTSWRGTRSGSSRSAGNEEWHGDPKGLVFPSETGGQRDSRSVLRNFRSLLRDAGFAKPHEWTARELRTSTVLLLSANGTHIEVIARVVGHSGTQTTERVYRKVLRPVITEGAEAMDGIFDLSADSTRETPSD
ncbi:tyrosine-type recombinase/integrase [Streptomyces sp. NPDC053079]|uniref:tyrosine-type recombinase/integrase n=1 Tax=Streptomyces sp. NPDC053079 TaxID=3365697 RepID=UPI0037CE564D